MPRQTIAIGADHAGFGLKQTLADEVRALGHELLDLGTSSEASVDYPDFGYAVADAVASGRADAGVLVCGTGVGISIAANRHAGVRAALVTDATVARLAREHNDANILALGARVTGVEVARDALRAFLSTPYAGGRHAARVAKLSTPRFEEAPR